jgi:adenine-specific DNA glycosylase
MTKRDVSVQAKVQCADTDSNDIFQRFAQAMVGWGEVTGRAMLPKCELALTVLNIEIY